jgi:ADP-ribose pyrophosphatase YjhB (NUDIX family)
MQKTTLLFLYKPKEKEILLGMKKRRFGEGKWNGVGGKLNEGETVKDALVRETKEEINVEIDSKDLTRVAILNFSFQNSPEWDQETHVFFIEKWNGDPSESEEMNPKWYSVNSLPFENMWVDDPFWLPRVLEGKKIKASFLFNDTGDNIIDMKVNEVANLSGE